MPNPSTVEVLEAARERITPEERWTRGAFARTADGGLLVDPTREDAQCWCAAGAIIAETGHGFGQASGFLARIEEATDGENVLDFNDGGASAKRNLHPDRHPRRAPARHKRVLAAFDTAIQAAQHSERGS